MLRQLLVSFQLLQHVIGLTWAKPQLVSRLRETQRGMFCNHNSTVTQPWILGSTLGFNRLRFWGWDVIMCYFPPHPAEQAELKTWGMRSINSWMMTLWDHNVTHSPDLHCVTLCQLLDHSRAVSFHVQQSCPSLFCSLWFSFSFRCRLWFLMHTALTKTPVAFPHFLLEFNTFVTPMPASVYHALWKIYF